MATIVHFVAYLVHLKARGRLSTKSWPAIVYFVLESAAKFGGGADEGFF